MSNSIDAKEIEKINSILEQMGNNGEINIDNTPDATPEPTTWAILGLLAALTSMMRVPRKLRE